MDVSEILQSYADIAAEQPLLLLTVIMAIGGAIGSIKIRSFSLGPAAVLFTALAFSAYDERLRLPQILGIFGLALFAYVIGVGAGPSFFAALRTGGRALGVVVGALLVGGLVTVGAANALGLEGPSRSGSYAGALTNTPALAAASETCPRSATPSRTSSACWACCSPRPSASGSPRRARHWPRSWRTPCRPSSTA